MSIIKPALGSYKISNQTHTSQGAGSVTKISDTEYKITKLAKGGTVVVSFDVVGTSHGTYQFGATVDPQSALDTNATNHRATISLNVNTKADESYQATNDCPAVVVTDVATGKVLKNKTDNITVRDTNLYENALSSRKLKLQGASTVVVIKSNYVQAGGEWLYKPGADGFPSKAIANLYSKPVTPTALQPFDFLGDVTSDYTFDAKTQILTLSLGAGELALVAMRPAGTDCRWQYFTIGVLANVVSTGCQITSTPAPTNKVFTIKNASSKFAMSSTRAGATIDTAVALHSGITDGRSYWGGNQYRLDRRETVEYVVKKGTAKTIKVTTDTCDNVSKLVANGKVKMTPTGATSLTIAIAADAKPTDSIKLGSITVKIVD